MQQTSPGALETSASDWVGRHGPILAACLAALVSIPSLMLPFLADDWALLASVAEGAIGPTPFGYFRPLCMASYALDRLFWGLHPSLFHLTNVLLACITAALVVIVARRLTGDPPLAGLAGILFALHPYHVENVSWIAGRADSLCTLLFLLSFLAYDRWRLAGRGIPIGSLVLFEAALLAKETAVVLPAWIILLALFDSSRRPGKAEIAGGYGPMLALAAGHFFLLRPLALGTAGWPAASLFSRVGVSKLLSFVAATVFPLHTEILEQRPFLWGALTLCVGVAALLWIHFKRQRVTGVFWAAAASFLLLLAPSLLSFQERYLFLPSAASCLALASLIRRIPRPRSRMILAAFGIFWSASLAWHWIAWREAGIASESLMDGLVQASLRQGVLQIAVANLPYRVHGVAIAGNFREAVRLSGGRPVEILTATALDYPDAHADALDASTQGAIRRPPPRAEVRLRIPAERFSRLVLPDPSPGTHADAAGWISVEAYGQGKILVRMDPDPEHTRGAYVWHHGRLEALF